MIAERRVADTATLLAELRREFPHWAFVAFGGRWAAVRGKAVIIKASSAEELRDRLRDPSALSDGTP